MNDLKLMDKLIGKKKTISYFVGIFSGACLTTLPIKLISLTGAVLILVANFFMVFDILKIINQSSKKKTIVPEANKEYIMSSILEYLTFGLVIILYTLIQWFANFSLVENKIAAAGGTILVIIAAISGALNKEIIFNRLKRERL